MKKEKFRAETLIRNALTNNVRYIINADRKSRTLIIVNAGIISVLMSLTGFQVPDEILPAIPKALLLIANKVSKPKAVNNIADRYGTAFFMFPYFYLMAGATSIVVRISKYSFASMS